MPLPVRWRISWPAARRITSHSRLLTGPSSASSVVHAVRYQSRKLGRTLEAYRFKPASETFARFFQGDASELEERLVESPIESWEQITSLLRDGRRHKGVDFKVVKKVLYTCGVAGYKNVNFAVNQRASHGGGASPGAGA